MDIGHTQVQVVINETTSLLPTASSHPRDINGFPTISSAVESLLASSTGITLESLLDSYPAFLNETRPIRATAFRLVVILYILADEARKASPSIPMGQSTLQICRTSYEQDTRRDNLQNIAITILGQISSVIEDVLQHPPSSVGECSMEDLLLASFTENDKFGNIRILDLLSLSSTPQTILRDKMVILSLTRLWKLGRRLTVMSSTLPINLGLNYKLQRVYDTVTSPRAIHGVHLLAHTTYLTLMAHFLLYPPHSSVTSVRLRDSLIVIYSLSNIIFDFWTSSSLLHLLVASSIITAVSFKSTTSFPASNTYSLLLIAFCFHILLLHFPNHHPTPLLLFEPSRILPKSSLYATSLRRGLFGAFVFLFPLFLVSALLFSLSMDGDFFSVIVISTPPYNSRMAFFVLFCVSFLLLLHFSTCGLLLSGSWVSDDNSIDGGWGSRGAASDIDARRYLVQAIITYCPSKPLCHLLYPPPFNLPTLLFQIFPSFLQNIQANSWKLFVGPFAFVVAGIWGWGLV